MRQLLFVILILGAGGVCAASHDVSSELPRSRDLDIDIPDLSDSLKNDPLITPVPIDPIPLKPTPKARPDQNAQTFTLNKIIIEGASLYKEAELLPVYRFFLNKLVSLDDLNKIARRIEKFYSNEGWLATQVVIPRQSIDSGVVRIRVFEGKIVDVVVEGDAGLAERFIKNALEDIKTGKPVKLIELEAALARLQDFSHLQLRPRIQASEKIASGVDLIVEVVSHKVYSGTLSLSNLSNDSTGPWSLFASTTFSFAPTEVSFLISNSFLDPKRSLFVRANYRHQINFYGSSMSAYISGNRTQPQNEDQSDPTLDDTGINFGLGFSQAGYRSAAFNFSTELNYDFSRRQVVRLGDRSIVTKGDTHILSLTLSGNYRSPWQSYTSVNAKIRQGLTEGGGPDNGNQSSSGRFQRRATWFTLDFLHLQTLLAEQDWRPNISLFFTGQGQYALDPLTNSQRISFGNTSIGRGFDSGRISGDHGWGTTIEARVSWRNRLQLSDRTLFRELVLYGFLDQGQTFYHNPDVDLQSRRKLRSAGIGGRMNILNLIYIDFTWARALNNPFDKPIALLFGFFPQGVDLSDKGSDDFLLRLNYFF